ncbi:energy transducer TonB [Sphingobacterium sp. LRF_L2]|uniref:energy transducer TonB n=1 Tax=Sphingobacterium sp. LRF_L2 TaxID=3369421 RepID=UPI003F60C048
MRFLLACTFSIFLFTSLSAQTKVDSLLWNTVDVRPQFRGGIKSWNRFLQQNLNLRNLVNDMDSTSYVDYGLRQTALLEFTVCEDGKVCDVDITNKDNISPLFAEEALRLMKKSPKWIPGTKDGKAVRTRFKQSITAELN